MIFNTYIYYCAFLFPSAVLFRIVPDAARPWVCAASGLLFYVYFSLTTAGGWAGAACVAIFLWEALVSRFYAPRQRICIAGIGLSLAVLVAFKYLNFATGFVSQTLSTSNPFIWKDAFLPLGVSFFTFEFIHYAVDRYRGTADKGTTAEYLAFIFFFPTMVAGPIKRFEDFVPCLQHPSKAWAIDWNRGVTRILAGLVKKFAAADLLTSFTDHLNAEDVARAERWILPVWLLAYGWKIYFDFSAYSDIAIGSGRLFGIRIPENFDWPYFRTNITSFWRHWHMSLNLWLVDYVFIPLGGSRTSSTGVYRNLMVVMLVSGLWHGANWNFVLWGAWHGLLLVLHRLWTVNFGHMESGPFARFCGWIATYIAVNIGWAFFAMDIPTALLFYRRLLCG
jgi:alginate O-acetyltransferase complex protein AlgI